MKVLGIETSCDETSAAVYSAEQGLLSNVVFSQDELHAPYGGIVPEVAARCHIERIAPIVDRALLQAGILLEEIDGIAVTSEPGLLGSLIVGLSYGKALAYSYNIPCIGIHHLEAHLHAIFIEKNITYPYVGLLISGGHTALYDVKGIGDLKLLGTTRDDAVGEAFDKVAKILGLGYPGGKKIDDLSKQGDPSKVLFPRPKVKDGSLDFSFSGLKTAVFQYSKSKTAADLQKELPDIAASFQEAAVDALIEPTFSALDQMGAHRLVISGGVAANSRVRSRFEEVCHRKGGDLHFPSLPLCTDNGAMVAALGAAYLKKGEVASLSLNAHASSLTVKRHESHPKS